MSAISVNSRKKGQAFVTSGNQPLNVTPQPMETNPYIPKSVSSSVSPTLTVGGSVSNVNTGTNIKKGMNAKKAVKTPQPVTLTEPTSVAGNPQNTALTYTQPTQLEDSALTSLKQEQANLWGGAHTNTGMSPVKAVEIAKAQVATPPALTKTATLPKAPPTTASSTLTGFTPDVAGQWNASKGYVQSNGLTEIAKPKVNELAGNNDVQTVWWSGVNGENTKRDPVTGLVGTYNTTGDNTTLTFGDGTTKRYQDEAAAKKAYLEYLNTGYVEGDKYGETQRLLSGANGAQTGNANAQAIVDYASKNGYTVERDPVTGYITSITKDKAPSAKPEDFAIKGETGTTLSSAEAMATSMDKAKTTAELESQTHTDAQTTADDTAKTLSGIDTAVSALSPSDFADPNQYQAELEAEKAKATKMYNDMNNLLLQTREMSIRNILGALENGKEQNVANYLTSMATATGRRMAGGIMAMVNAQGITTYVDSALVDLQAKQMGLNAAEAAALNAAQTSYVDGAYKLATEQLATADSLRVERMNINDKIQSQKENTLKLKAMEQADAQNTITTLVASGISPDKIGADFFAHLDNKSQLPAGTSRGLYDFAVSDKSKTDAATTASELVKATSALPAGADFYVDGNAYGKFNSGDVQTHYEVSKDGKMTVSIVDKATHKVMNVMNLGYADQKHEEFKDKNGVTTWVFPDGTQKTVFDPNQPNGGYAVGGAIDLFPPGTKVGDHGWCGEFQFALKGIHYGNTFESKMSHMDSSITAETARVGDTFVQNIGHNNTGHIGTIAGKWFGGDGKWHFRLLESNYHGDGLVTNDREVTEDEIKGYSHDPFVNPDYNFASSDSKEDTGVSDFSTRYAMATTESDRASVLAQADKAGYSQEDIIKGISDTNFPYGFVYNPTTKLGINLDTKQQQAISDLSVNLNVIKSIKYLLDKGSAGTGPIDQFSPGIFNQDQKDLANKIGDLSSMVVLERSGSAVSASESERLKDVIPTMGTLESTNKVRVVNFATKLLDETAAFLRSKGASVAGQTVTVEQDGKQYEIPIDAFDSSAMKLIL